MKRDEIVTLIPYKAANYKNDSYIVNIDFASNAYFF